MAIDRWFAGLKLRANYWRTTTFVAEEGYDTYFISFRVQTSILTKFTSFKIYGTPDESLVDNIELFEHPAISALVSFNKDFVTKVKLQTPMYPVIKAAAADTQIIAYGNYCQLPILDKKRTWKEIEWHMNNYNIINMMGLMVAGDTNEWVLERQISVASTPIIQPCHQGGPLKGAVADELNISSTSDLDCYQGWDAVIKGTPPYTGATANGLVQGVSYYFKVTVDGGSEVEYTLVAGVAGDMDFLIGQLEALTALDALVTWSITEGEFRCTSKKAGGGGTVLLAAGTTGADMFATLTDYGSLHGSNNPTGAQKIAFQYYNTDYELSAIEEIEMAGVTPIDLILLYPDVWLIKHLYPSQLGSLGYNAGNVFFHDDA